MAYQLLISAGAKEDLHDCRKADSWAASQLSAFLREVRDDAIASEALADERTFDHEFSVELLGYLHDKRINAYRVRVVTVAKWRIITAVDHRQKRVGVFAVMFRDKNYEADRELTARIEKEYDEYGFPRY